MPGALIRLDQDRPGPTVSAGTVGVARKDLWLNNIVRPTSTLSGNGSFEWVLLDKPPGSTATLTNSSQAACFFTPDLVGSYRIKLITNSGGPGNEQILIAAVTKTAVGVTTYRGLRIPAFGEKAIESNFFGQLRGWKEAFEDLFNDIVANIGSGSGAPAGVCTLEQFGAVGDGVVNDQTAIALAAAALLAGTYKTLSLGAKTYLGTWGFAIPAGCSVIGQGPGATVCKQVGAPTPVFTIGAVNDVEIRGLRIQGDGTATAPAYGIRMGLIGVPNSGPQRVHISDVVIDFCWAGGVSYYRSPKTNYEGPSLNNVYVTRGFDGFLFSEEGEYATLTNCHASTCTNGIRKAAGNITLVGCTATANTNGLVLDGGVTNDAHGVNAGCNFNHNSTANVVVGAIVNGENFSGCNMYAGNINLTTSKGVSFEGCFIDALVYNFNGSTGTRFADCVFPSAYTNTVNDNVAGNASETQWLNCRNLDGDVPAWVGDRQRLAFSFLVDANSTLTTQQAEAEQIFIQSGTITAPRQITIPKSPAKGNTIFFRNLTVYSITIKWSTGATVTLGPGLGALIGADGTNATIVLGEAVSLVGATLTSPTIIGTPTMLSATGKLAVTTQMAELNNLTTTAASTLYNQTIQDESFSSFDIFVSSCRRTAATKAGRYKRSISYRRTAAGAPIIVGALESGTDQTTTSGTITVGLGSGGTANNLVIQVLQADTDARNWTVEVCAHVTVAT